MNKRMSSVANVNTDQAGANKAEPKGKQVKAAARSPRPVAQEVKRGSNADAAAQQKMRELRDQLQRAVLEQLDVEEISSLSNELLTKAVRDIVIEILAERRIAVNKSEMDSLIQLLLDEMVGLGPLEPLLHDESISDILVNGPERVYVERNGRLFPTTVRFRDDAHLMNVITRMVSKIGRRVDTTSPMVDARLDDGSRVNVVIPPLAIQGPTVSIRKFNSNWLTLDAMAQHGSMSDQMAQVLKIAARCRANVLVSGGTGAGKTTLLNAMSHMIQRDERIVTIENAAELQLQQPHVVTLETRTANLEGEGEVTSRDLLINSLRMRPDRIIVGEVRGEEVIDMLQAMNTGHDGSLGTIHANGARDALVRVENMVRISWSSMPLDALRAQIASALDLIVHVVRMRDGKRRIMSITEVTGTEGPQITTQDLYKFQLKGEGTDGSLDGEYVSSGFAPKMCEKAEQFGLRRALMEACQIPT